MITTSESGPAKPRLFLVGVPGKLGGAATKIAHLIGLLHRDFKISVVLPDPSFRHDKEVRAALEPYGIARLVWKELPGKVDGVALAVCDEHFFTSGRIRELKRRGLKVVWSNDMMFPFKGEAEAAREGLIDRVLFVSEFQRKAFADVYLDVPSFLTGNYVDPEAYGWQQRRNPVFAIGRLSRPDPGKYPLDFPVFYEELGLREVKYRVMAWSPEVQKQYRWHRFGPEWELLPANKEPALKFLHSLDLFVYPIGHRVRESWGRAVVEAMLSGAVPVVPAGHEFERFVTPAQTGFICREFGEWKAAVGELRANYGLRLTLSRQAAEYAREALCNPADHRRRWMQALTF